MEQSLWWLLEHIAFQLASQPIVWHFIMAKYVAANLSSFLLSWKSSTLLQNNKTKTNKRDCNKIKFTEWEKKKCCSDIKSYVTLLFNYTRRFNFECALSDPWYCIKCRRRPIALPSGRSWIAIAAHLAMSLSTITIPLDIFPTRVK